MCDKSDEEHCYSGYLAFKYKHCYSGYLGFVRKSRKLNKVRTNIAKASQIKKKGKVKKKWSKQVFSVLFATCGDKSEKAQTLSLWIFRVLFFCLQIAITEQSTNNHC